MATTVYRLITIISLVSLLHCAYSAAQHRSYLRLTEQPFINLPSDVLAQTIVSLLALIYGTSFLSAPFQFIKKDQHHDRTCDEALNCPSFITFDNRAKAMSPEFAMMKAIREANAARRVEMDGRKTSSSSKNTLNFDNIPGARVPKNAKPTRILEITKEQADEAIKSCLDLIRKHDRESYLTILAMPKAVQVELIAINALNVELAQIRDKVDTRRGDTSAMYRLQFWKDALASIFDASPLPVPRQPVAIALCVAASRTRQPELLAKLVQTRQATIGDKQFENIEAVAEYGRNTTGAILQLEIDVLSRGSGVDDKVFELARELGASYAIANLIRSTHPLLARGIVLLPRDIVELHGTSADAIYNKKKIEESRGVAKDLARESERILENVRDQIDQIPKDLRIVFAGHAISIDFILGTLKKKDFDLYSAFLQRPNGLMVWKLLCCKLTGRF
ncbi:unnamed protein product [Caenorhabditis angaria]|uniref:Uncharacterized protein n=1 Tax=Caenorhabditis angaria TaxID=860376 RepID=A0A9P1I9Y9_9PELO|nr:unnamed protein product [Caenorhabditis angaria]